MTNGHALQRLKTDSWEIINYDVEGDSCRITDKEGPLYRWSCKNGSGPSEAIIDCRDRKIHTLAGGVFHDLISQNARLVDKEMQDTEGRYLRIRYRPPPDSEITVYSVNRTPAEKHDKCLCELGRSGLLDMNVKTWQYSVRKAWGEKVNIRSRCARSRD